MDFKFALDFLSRLKQNNNREWFNSNRKDWEKIKSEFSAFVALLIEDLAEFEPALSTLEPKHCTFRLNRDIRFSTDKSPYKTHIGAYMADGGKKSPKAGYYFHLQPSGSLVAGGIWMPESGVLSKIREEIDYCGEEFTDIISAPAFRKYFSTVDGDALKTAPKGYSQDHPMIRFLRLKSFTVSHSISDQQLQSVALRKTCTSVFKEIKPLNDFLNRALES